MDITKNYAKFVINVFSLHIKRLSFKMTTNYKIDKSVLIHLSNCSLKVLTMILSLTHKVLQNLRHILIANSLQIFK